MCNCFRAGPPARVDVHELLKNIWCSRRVDEANFKSFEDVTRGLSQRVIGSKRIREDGRVEDDHKPP
jgi:hypothetical protein